MYKTVLSACAALLLGACSGSTPDESTFERSINRYLAGKGVCVPLAVNIETNGTTVPALLGLSRINIPDRNLNGEKTNRQAIAQMRILDDEGLYRKQSSETFEFPGSKNKATVYVYEITEKGKGKVKGEGLAPHFCIGTQKVEKINWFTEPAPSSDGMMVSKVSYEARFEAEKWAEKFWQEAGNGRSRPETTRTKTATLVKTNDGWRDIRELR